MLYYKLTHLIRGEVCLLTSHAMGASLNAKAATAKYLDSFTLELFVYLMGYFVPGISWQYNQKYERQLILDIHQSFRTILYDPTHDSHVAITVSRRNIMSAQFKSTSVTKFVVCDRGRVTTAAAAADDWRDCNICNSGLTLFSVPPALLIPSHSTLFSLTLRNHELK